MIVEESKQSEIRSIIDGAQARIKDLLGVPVTISYTLRFKNIDPAHIVEITCKECNVYMSDIKSEKQTRELMVPRKIIAWMLYHYCNLTEWQIGKFFAKGHSSISKYISDVNDMIDTGDDLYLTPLKEIERIILKKEKAA